MPARPAQQPDRTAVRRRALLDAGIALLGAVEPGAVNVRAVCRSTGITERYFYEIFGNRDDYVRAVYDDVTAQLRAVLVEVAARSGDNRALATEAVGAFVGLVVDHPGMGRVLLLAPYREPALIEAGLGHLPEFFDVAAAAVPGSIPDEVRRLVAVEVVGAMTALFTQFLGGTLGVDRDRLVAHCVDLLVAAAERAGRAADGD